ncbi:MAG TPA: hypothetical protein VHY08_21865 [Bacillota bacterium]|nr:hypothetical protein [Bacillota bacterium]
MATIISRDDFHRLTIELEKENTMICLRDKSLTTTEEHTIYLTLRDCLKIAVYLFLKCKYW